MDFLNLDFLSNVSESQLGIAGVGILIFSIIFGIIKGVIRIILGLAGLVAGAVAFWFTFQHGDSLASNFVEDPEPWMPLGIAGGAASAAYLAVRHGVGLVMAPIIGSVDALKNKKLLAGFMGLGLGGAGLYGGGSAAHQVDAMSFLDEQRKGEEVGWVSNVLTKAQETWFGKVQQKTDPTETGFKCDLVKLLSLAKFQGDGANSSEIRSALSNSDLQSLLSDRQISSALEEGDFQTLLRNDKLDQFLKDPRNRDLLLRLDWRQVMGR